MKTPTGTTYRIGAAFVVGVLVAGLGFRLTNDRDEQATNATASDVLTSDGGVLGVDESGAPGSPTGEEQSASTGDTVAPGSGPSAPSGATGPLTASDIGVTPTAIRIGIGLGDSSTLSMFTGGATFADVTSVESQRATWQALIEEVNRNGGVLGRKIVPFYRTLDLTSPADQRAACNDWTETNKVFAVFAMGTLSSFGGGGELCVAVEHRTLTFDDSPQLPKEFFEESNGLIINTTPDATQAIADTAFAFEHYGLLRGRTLGLIIDQGQGESIARRGLVPALQSMGYSIKYTGVVATDPSQGPSQAVTHVSQMRSAGVDAVIDATSFVNMTAFVSAAQGQGYRPKYLVSAYDGNDIASFLGGLPSSFDGATVVSYTPYDASSQHPEDAVTQSCREKFNSLRGTSYKAGQLDITTIRFVVTPCATMRLLLAAATATGPNLTRAAVSAAIQRPGFSSPMQGMGGSWGPGKTGFNDVVRSMVWGPPNGTTKNCTSNGERCWNDAGAPFNPRTKAGA